MKCLNRVLRLLSLLCVILSAGCVKKLPNGSVVDSSTGQPVGDAYVIANFLGDGIYAWPDPGATARDECYGTLITKTDSRGRYDFSPLREVQPKTEDYNRNQKIEINVYKPGYTMGKLHERTYTDKKLPRTLFPSYVKAEKNNQTILLNSTSEEQLNARAYYIKYLADDLCEGYGNLHWEFERTVLIELGQLAEDERGWWDVNDFCEKINLNNIKHKLKKEILDCHQYETKALKHRASYKLRLKQVIENVNWGDGLKLEYLDLFDLESDTNSTIFLTRTPISEINAKSIFAALKKVCESEFPRNIGEGHVCIILNKVPDDYEENRSELCDVRYLGRIERLRIYVGKEADTFVDANPGWCR